MSGSKPVCISCRIRNGFRPVKPCGPTGRAPRPSRSAGPPGDQLSAIPLVHSIYAGQRLDSWFNYVIIFGEMLIGIGLIVGGLTAIAAFFGILMNFTFLYAGSVSSNPTFIVLGVLIILGWRVAGWWGLDRFLLPWLGTPWQPGRLRPQPAAAAHATSARAVIAVAAIRRHRRDETLQSARRCGCGRPPRGTMPWMPLSHIIIVPSDVRRFNHHKWSPQPSCWIFEFQTPLIHPFFIIPEVLRHRKRATRIPKDTEIVYCTFVVPHTSR